MKKAKRFNVGGSMATSVAPNGPVSLVKNGLGGLPSSSLPPPSKNIQQGDAFPQGSGPRPTGPALGGVGPRPTGPESPTDMTKINALKAQLNAQNSSDTGYMSPRRVAAKLSGIRGAMGTPGIRPATASPSSEVPPLQPRPSTPETPRPPTPTPVPPSLQPQPANQIRSNPMAKYDATAPQVAAPYKKGGAVKASKRGDGIAQRGKTKGRMV